MSSISVGNALRTEQMIERQMRLWQARRRAVSERPMEESALRFRFMTICRGDGTLGDEVAHELARRLGWHVFDKEIVNYIAQNSHVRESLVLQQDERSQGLIAESITRLLRMPEWASFGCDEYHEALVKTLAFLAMEGDAILVGRGANFALRREKHGLHIRTEASLQVRLGRLSRRWQVPPKDARRCMVATDEDRKNFIRHHFKKDLDDLSYYDAVFNTDHLTADNVADSVMAIMESRANAGAGRERGMTDRQTASRL
jgi:cytidylate kinase